MLLFLTVALLSIVLLRTCIMKIRIITLSGGAEVDRVLQCKALKKGYFLEAQSRVCMLGGGVMSRWTAVSQDIIFLQLLFC